MRKQYIYSPLEYFQRAEYSEQGGERTLLLQGDWDATGYDTPVNIAIATMVNVARQGWKQRMLCEESQIDFDHSVTQVGFNFAGTTILCKADSNATLLERDFHRALNGFITKTIGPHPAHMTAADVQDEAAQLEAKKREQAEASIRRQAEREAQKAVFKAQISLLSPMEWEEGGSQARWETEFCTPGCRQMGEFCEALARLIQVGLANGQSFEAAAGSAWKEVSHVIGDVGGSCTEAFAIEHLIGGKWKYADALRRESNARHGKPDASGVTYSNIIDV